MERGPFGAGGRTYDVDRSGQRFLMVKQEELPAGPGPPRQFPELVVVQHWFEELKRLVPVN